MEIEKKEEKNNFYSCDTHTHTHIHSQMCGRRVCNPTRHLLKSVLLFCLFICLYAIFRLELHSMRALGVCWFS